ncbi:hypothetical protein BST95_12255 [Halioglobus japonicus]|nr:hypothetical protein BST95_12255 [Halioglobus japonicus]GHD24672.1 hypothetical protein GCM10007052_38300 [Halioglobus japonicus]
MTAIKTPSGTNSNEGIGTGTAGATESTGVGAAVTEAGPYVRVPLVCANATEERVSDELAAHTCLMLMLSPLFAILFFLKILTYQRLVV